ncbi:alpha/beta-hydrolase [Gymnopus androsaceus JB14]|uniref:Alpha/beta-hydrolase n=1 Tax=Gymnopus androsaceus JB14 TaxID=1447944 RepID=A0A6A4I4J7_9AGAR|nr:alpha/beta-hydrolase [Gymnopus androsaceus JB14]
MNALTLVNALRLFMLYVYSLAFSKVSARAIVKLDYGTFIGVENVTAGITAFLGVRYAEPPIGKLRWKAPVFPPTTHLGVVIASSFGNALHTSSSNKHGIWNLGGLPVCKYDITKVKIFLSWSGITAQRIPIWEADQQNNPIMGDSASLSYMPEYDSDYINGIFDLFAEFAGCSSSSEVMACLLAADSDTIAAAGSQVVDNRTSTLFVFEPCVDGTLLRPGQSKHLLVAPSLKYRFYLDEGANWSAELTNPAVNTSEPSATKMTVYNFISGQFPSLTSASFNAALEHYPLADYNDSLSLQGQQMYGEARCICSGLMYRYDNPDQGSVHAYDLIALFYSPSKYTGDDGTLFAAMQQYWSSFVTSQTPSATNASICGGCIETFPLLSLSAAELLLFLLFWPVTNSSLGSSHILLHPGEITMENVTDAQAARCAFWSSLSAEMNT